MSRNSPPLPGDGIYRAILLVLVLSICTGAIVVLAGRLVMHNEAVTEAGLWLTTVSAGIYAFFRWLGVREARRRARAADVTAEFLIWTGDPGSSITAAAEAEGADLVVVGTRGRSGAERMLLGSVSDHVVRNAACPVLLVRPTERHQSGP